MTKRQVTVKFSVNYESGQSDGDQTVCIVGNDERIGSWDPLRAVRMEKDATNQKSWTCSVDLDNNTEYSYRFFVGKSCRSRKDVTKDGLIVVQWETNAHPRQFASGNQDSLELPEASFGIYDSMTTMNVSDGWLMGQCEIQLRLHSDPISLWKPQHISQDYNVKCIASSLVEEDHLKLNHNTEVLVSNLCEGDCRPKLQEPQGTKYSEGNYMIFRARSNDTNHLGFQFDIYHHSSSRSPYLIGSAHLLPWLQEKSKLSQTLPIIGINEGPVGALNVDILVVRCLTDVPLTMESSTVHCWKRGQLGEKAWDVGHRGFGESYSRDNHKRENTLESFKAAADHGADCVEFDVVMTRDFHPVVFHDFCVSIACAHEKPLDAEHDLHEIPIKDLTLRQLQSLKLFAAGSKKAKITDEMPNSNHSVAFPTLATCLQEADDRLRFNIEIKFPQLLETGVSESDNFFDHNLFVDKILEVVFEHAGPRMIVFSSFEPDICCLLQLKQNKYPVLFLTQGKTRIYTHYLDFRCKTFASAINFAVAEQIMGVVLHTEVLLRDMSVIQRVQEKNLTLFVWGADNNSADIINRLRHSKVDGIIYDRIDCHKPEHQLKFISSNNSIPSLMTQPQ